MVRSARTIRCVVNPVFMHSSGKQKRGAMIAFFGFYLFGIPLAAVLMFFVRLDIFGFWLGIIVAETITNTLLFILVQRFNWERHAKAALLRITFNPKTVTTDIATIPTSHDKPSEPNVVISSATDDTSWIKLIRTKLIVLLLLICVLIAGIVVSSMVSL
jgi:hypothetical protein